MIDGIGEEIDELLDIIASAIASGMFDFLKEVGQSRIRTSLAALFSPHVTHLFSCSPPSI